MFDIPAELKKIPHQPGVYLMHEGDLILYVGKAVDLHNRVRQYFQSPKGKSEIIRRMVQRIEYFEYIVTDTEMEALILENNLIKKHRPPYNTLLKDDKQYPYIKVTTQEAFPRIYKTRKILRDGARYFGPYTNVLAVNELLELMEKLWPLKTCQRVLPRDIGKERPCLNLYIGKCCGPCTGKVDRREYMAMIDQAITLLSGKHDEIIQSLKKEMLAESEALHFEQAAVLRDRIKSIEFISQTQKIENAGTDEDRDVIALFKADDAALVQVFFIRGGKLTGREHFMMESAGFLEDSQIIGAFIQQFYSGTAFIPREILVEAMPEDQSVLEEFLTAKLASKNNVHVHLVKPIRGDKAKLVEMAHENAKVQMNIFGQRLRSEEKRTKGAVRQLETLLGFDEYPIRRIEAYDISNTFGTQSVGSMVVFEDGRPKNSDYRKFKIETVVGSNDYASMEEVLTRRFSHALEEIRSLSAEGKDLSLGSFTKLPDLLLMDGGRGQVNIALGVLQKLGLDIPVAGMVKDDHHRTRGLYFNNKEIDFGSNRDAFLLITRIQDEAHRFAITYHRKLRQDAQTHSILEDIPGIGEVRRKLLLKHFASIDEIASASVEELAKVDGMNTPAAESVYRFFEERRKAVEESLSGPKA
ncbi:MAG: excinuclease ABC subunit UvrC [Firmicutes bacterium]|nr:excinuclease ABC subunit UvrC [Bacillota bacterium]